MAVDVRVTQPCYIFPFLGKQIITMVFLVGGSGKAPGVALCFYVALGRAGRRLVVRTRHEDSLRDVKARLADAHECA